MGGAEVDAKSCVIFLKAAETGSITKAALALGYTQAGVSLVVRKIEEECGFPLLIREKNGVRLTDAGERMLPVMREIARWDERFRETAAEILLGGLPAGIHPGELTWEALAWERETEQFLRRGRLQCRAYFLAQTEDEETMFLDFRLKGAVTT